MALLGRDPGSSWLASGWSRRGEEGAKGLRKVPGAPTAQLASSDPAPSRGLRWPTPGPAIRVLEAPVCRKNRGAFPPDGRRACPRKDGLPTPAAHN